MKSVVDLFIVKDRTAVFWFTMACVSIVCSAIYVQRVLAAINTKPQYVIMDASGVYYLAPSVDFEKARALHAAQTRLAMETLYTRDMDHLHFGDREKKLFNPDSIEQIRKDFLHPDATPFFEQKVQQTVEVLDADVVPGKITSRMAITYAKARLTRKSTFKGQEKIEHLTVTTYFYWLLNPRMASNGFFPTVCAKIEQRADPIKEIPTS